MKILAALAAVVLLSGCATFSPEKVKKHADVWCVTALFVKPAVGLPLLLVCPFIVDELTEEPEPKIEAPNV